MEIWSKQVELRSRNVSFLIQHSFPFEALEFVDGAASDGRHNLN